MHLLYTKCMERGESIHNKLFKFFMMPILMMLISVGQVWGETIEHKDGGFSTSSKDGVYTVKAKYNDDLAAIVTMLAQTGTNNSRVQIKQNSTTAERHLSDNCGE